MPQMFVPFLHWYATQSPSRLRKFRVLKFIAKFCDGGRVKTPAGPTIRVSSADDTNLFCIYGTYDDVTGYVKHYLKKGDCFLDIGTNLGFFSLLASQAVGETGHVVSFEPSPRELSSLARNLHENQCTNVTVLGVAVSDRTEILNFSPGPASHTGIGSLAPGKTGGLSVLAVNLQKHCQFLEELLKGRDFVIKIDVEGAEIQVLNSLSSLLRFGGLKAVIVEIHAKNLAKFGTQPEDIYQYLESHGWMPASRKSGDWYDALFLRA